MRIITIDREFGSGGRELGKRLADALQIPCYDQEIIEEVAKMHGLEPNQVEHISESDVRAVYPMTIGRRFHVYPVQTKDAIRVLSSQQNVIRTLAASGDCVIVGRCADVILKDLAPLNLFVYSDQESKLLRCMQRIKKNESERDVLHMMKKIDRERAACRELMTDSKWGQKETYHLCVNTSDKTIKQLVPALTAYIDCWFDEIKTENRTQENP